MSLGLKFIFFLIGILPQVILRAENITCSSGCSPGPDNKTEACNITSGECLYGCQDGFYDSNCNKAALIQTNPACDALQRMITGHCDGGECKYTSYCGRTCEVPCQDGCKSQHCNKSCDCNEGCNLNYWGGKCTKLCNANCIQPTNSGSRKCDMSDGTCLYGCKDSKYWGNECKMSCSGGCINETCQQDSGNCTEGCKSKTVYGERCDAACNENCLNATCERAVGYCDKGCATGWYGEQCNLKCIKNCINSTCERLNGSCANGCITGFYGQHCDEPCSDKCLGLKCDRVGGNCTDGCISGYQGFQCKSVIPRNNLTDTIGGKAPGCTGCPDYWVTFHANCYSFNNTRLNWFRATKACKDQGAKLVDVTSKIEEEFLRGTIQRLHAHDDPQTVGYWTSGNDLEVEGQWVWGYPSEIAATFTDWSPGEPNNRADPDGRAEDCAVLWGHNAHAYRWNDQPCDTRDYYICKRSDASKVIG